MADKKFEVTGMFLNGKVEVHEVGTENYTILDINDLMADKAALDAMQKAQADGTDEQNEFLFELSKRRELQGI